MVIPPRGAPVFLLDTTTYKDYINAGFRGTLTYPPPPPTSGWGVKIHPGEAFCRVPNCMFFRYPYFSTSVLRAHLKRHGLQVSGRYIGGMSKANKKDVIRWYRGLLGESDTEEEEYSSDSSVSSDSDEEDGDKEDDDKEDDEKEDGDKEDDDEEGGVEVEAEDQ